MGKPSFYAVHTKTGMHVGLWRSKHLAEEALREYDGGTMTPLYEGMAAREGHLDPTTGWEGEEKLTVEEAWMILCETPDITSPEEYPDHALITMEQLGSFMARAAAPSACGKDSADG
jgi:hypothetical protein